MTKFEVIPSWSENDRTITAEVPELSDCTSHGPTKQAALKNVDVVIGEGMQTAQPSGWTVPQPRGGLVCP